MTRHWFRKKDGRSRTAGTLFDDAVVMLEERVMLDAVPTATFTTPSQIVPLANPDGTFSAHVLFDNAPGATDTGYGPFVQLIVPTHGVDGPSVADGITNDGITFTGASYLGNALNPADVFDLTFTNVGGTVQATNPLTNGVVLASDYGAQAGDHLVVLRLPFGSFTVPQTPADIQVDFTLSRFADLGTPLNLHAVGGFQYGTTPTGNTPVVQAAASASIAAINPSIVTGTVTTDTENNVSAEVATGPNQAYNYFLNIDVATGQTITDRASLAQGPTLSATLPDSLVYQGINSVTVGGVVLTQGTDFTVVAQPTTGAVVTAGADALSIKFANPITGVAGNDIVISYSGYVNDVRGSGAPVLAQGGNYASTSTDTDMSFSYNWNALDPRDRVAPAETLFSPLVGPDLTVANRPIAIQKSNSFIDTDGSGNFSPGDIVVYALEVQVSDYYSLGDIVISDVLSDGQRIDTGFVPTIAVTQRGAGSGTQVFAGVGVTASEFTGNFASVFNGATGETTSTINVSAAVVANGIDADGVLDGGRVPGQADAGGTIITITFQAVLQNNFVGPVTGNAAVDQGDSVGNTAQIAASVRDSASPANILGAAVTRDDAATQRGIVTGGLDKTIVAINGAAPVLGPGGEIRIKAGDTVTYRLQYTLPISSFENLNFTDYLPLPIFVVGPGFTLTQDGDGGNPEANEFGYGDANTFVPASYPGAPTAPTVTYDTAGNSVNFNFGSYSAQDDGGVPNSSSVIDLLFTVVVGDTPFADGLYLTNLASSSENNTAGVPSPLNSVVQVRLSQPKVAVQKAIVAVGASGGTVTTPEAISGFAFNPVGSATGFTGAVNDTTLGATPNTKAAPNIDSNVTGLDAGDTARVALVINNEGSGANGAYDINVLDALPAGVGLIGTGNFTLAYGDGTAVGATDYTISYYTDAAGTVATLDPSLAVSFRIQLNDTAGATLQTDGAAGGRDIIIVTYDIALQNSVAITPTALTSTAAITNYAALDGGVNQVTTPITDNATIGLGAPTVVKALVPGSSTDASTAEPGLTIGEQQSYTVTYTLPEGTLGTVRLQDILPNSATAGRYEIVSATVTSVGANLRQSVGGTAVDAAYIGAATLSSSAGNGINDTATFGAAGFTVVNQADNASGGADQIVVTYVVRALNNADNTQGDAGVNTGRIIYGPGNTVVNATSPISVALPQLVVDKVLTTPAPIDASDTITFTIDVRHAAGSLTSAYDLNFSDVLPTGLTNLVVTGITTNTTLTTGSFTTDGTTVTFAGGTQGVFDLAVGQFFRITVTANVSASAQAGATYTNTATVDYSTLDGAVGGERSGITVSDGANVTIPVILTKSFSADPLVPVVANQAVVGSTITYYILATLPEGFSNNFTITDTLAAGLTFVSGQVVSIGGNISGSALAAGAAPSNAGQLVTFSFGNLSDLVDGLAQGGGDRVIVQINARISNEALVRGASILNTGFQGTDVNGTPIAPLASNNVTTTIVDPNVTISKTVNAVTTAASGDTVQYTSVITASAGANFANAQDVVFTDVLGSGATLSGGTVTIDGVVYTVNGAAIGGVSVVSSGSGFSVRFGELATGASHTLVYNATVSAGAGSTVNNNAVVTYDAIDSGGASTADTQNDRNQSASDDAPLGTIGIVKTITATADANTGTAQVRAGVQDLAIGETATVQIVLNVPAGGRTFTLGDLLDLNGIGRLTLNGGAAGVTVSTGAGVTFTTAPVITLPDLDADGNPDLNIAFSMAGGSAAGTITITYVATAADVVGNASGDQLNLPATLTYSAAPPAGIAGTLAASIGVDLVEPSLVIDKSVATSDPTPNAGDIVTYTVLVTNNGTGPAYGVTINDPLPAGLSYTGTSTLTLSIGGAQPTPGNPASITLARLMPGESATLVYSAVIGNAAVTGVPITNTATIAASGTTPGGGGRPGPTPSDSTNFTVEALQGLEKTISATSDPNTGTGADRPVEPDLHIGEIATIDLTVRLTEGSTGTVVVTDKLQLPAGTLTLVGAPTIVNANGTTFTGTGTAGYTLTDTDGDGTPDTITMDFGTVTVPGNNLPGDNFFVIRYTAVVGDRPENQAGDRIDLTATLTTALGLTSVATARADVVAPQLVLTKAAMAGFVSRGDTVGYTISLTNTGASPAYDLALGDVLPAGLSYVAGTTALTVGGVTTTFASPNAITLAMLGAGQTATISYQVLVDPAVAASAAYTNTATVNYDSLAGAGGRTGSASGTATISTPTNVLGLSKSIINTSIPETGATMFRAGVTDLNVGEHAFIDLTASFTEGTTGSVVLTDQLPLGSKFQLVGTPTVTLLGGITTSLPGTVTLVDTDGDGLADRLSFDFGTVMVPIDGDPTNNLIRVRYEVLVPDVAANVPGTTLDSPALLTSAVGNASAGTFADIVAPNVGITKGVAAAGADAGDIKSYTVTLINNGTGPAFDLTIADALPAGLTAVAGTTVLTVGGVSTAFASPASIPLAFLGVAQSAVLTFNAVIGDGTVGGTVLTNSATVSYDSLAGAGGHPGSASATASFTTAAVQTLDKAIVATSEAFTGLQYVRPGTTDLTVGERVTFELTTGFSEGTTTNVVLTDQLVTAAGVLTFTGTPTLVLPAGATITGSVTPQLIDTNGDGVPDQVRFNLGTVTIPGDNNPANNVIRIRYDAVLPNSAANVAGNQLTLPATLTSSSGSLTDSEAVDIVAPVLTIGKALAPTQPLDGQTTVFLITIGHAPGSTAAATNIVLTEMLPPGALLAGVTVVSGPAGATINGNVVTVPLLGVGETVTIQVSTSIDFASPPSGDTINTATVGYGTATGSGGRAVTGVAATATLPFGNPTTSLFRDIRERNELSSMGHYFDYRYVEDFPEIDPVYSGSAAPGTFVTIDVADETGSSSGFGTGVADAGGNWLVRLPSTTMSDRLERSRFDSHYDGARLFRSPNGELFDDRSLLGFDRLGDRLSVGSRPAYNTQVVRVHVGGQGAGFGASFAPAWRDQFFSMEPGLSIEGAFRGRASSAVEGLLEGLTSPEDAGLNRFNREFLTTADF